jgi:hypothetical protein
MMTSILGLQRKFEEETERVTELTGFEVLGVQIVSKATTAVAGRVIEGILQRQDETLAILKTLKKDVEALLHGPYRTALGYIAEASVPSRTPKEFKKSLLLARQELMRAIGQEHDKIFLADASITLAIVLWALHRPEDAVLHAINANQSFISGIDDIIGKQNSDFRRKRLIYKFSGLGAITQYEKDRAKLEEMTSNLSRLCERAGESARFARALAATSDSVVMPKLEYVPENTSVTTRPAGGVQHITVLVSKAPPSFRLVRESI